VEYVVLDTDVASASLRRRMSPRMKALLAGSTWCASFVTVAELWQWADVRSWGRESRDELEDWLAHVVVIDSDDDVCRVWGRTAATARLRGRARPTNDSWIAACCLAKGLPLATRNVKDYADFVEHDGLQLALD